MRMRMSHLTLNRCVTASQIVRIRITVPTISSFTTFLTSPTRTPLIATIAPDLDSVFALIRELASKIDFGAMGRLTVTTSLMSLQQTATVVKMICSSDASTKA